MSDKADIDKKQSFAKVHTLLRELLGSGEFELVLRASSAKAASVELSAPSVADLPQAPSWEGAPAAPAKDNDKSDLQDWSEIISEMGHQKEPVTDNSEETEQPVSATEADIDSLIEESNQIKEEISPTETADDSEDDDYEENEDEIPPKPVSEEERQKMQDTVSRIYQQPAPAEKEIPEPPAQGLPGEEMSEDDDSDAEWTDPDDSVQDPAPEDNLDQRTPEDLENASYEQPPPAPPVNLPPLNEVRPAAQDVPGSRPIDFIPKMPTTPTPIMESKPEPTATPKLSPLPPLPDKQGIPMERPEKPAQTVPRMEPVATANPTSENPQIKRRGRPPGASTKPREYLVEHVIEAIDRYVVANTQGPEDAIPSTVIETYLKETFPDFQIPDMYAAYKKLLAAGGLVRIDGRPYKYYAK